LQTPRAHLSITEQNKMETESAQLEEIRESGALPVFEQTYRSQDYESRLRLLKETARELSRGALAFLLAVIFGASVWWAFEKVGIPAWNDTKQLLDVLIPTESALLASAVAFFFSSL
jgi:hypothetical protein